MYILYANFREMEITHLGAPSKGVAFSLKEVKYQGIHAAKV